MKPQYLSILATTILAVSASGAHSGGILTKRGEADYEARIKAQPLLAERLAVPENLTQDEEEAMKFLYAYIQTPDALDYDNDFFLRNIRLALQARREMPWGTTVPDREWRHFVLPVRVNNENLDNSREVFFKELKERVKNLSMKEAILEVNHWCHEKVSYQPSDARTSSPLATVANALGRCGEESTFTVAALRSIGIPARQVYTPRWAHTDDNHAWVEAWADGEWYFLGACEPEPVLDLAWFNAPAGRGMLMDTRVVGAYDGPEELLESDAVSTVINVTDKYAPVSKSTVYVYDRAGKPLEGAEVRFSLYNYAELFPLAVKKSDADGRADFTSGLGDMVVWGSDGKNFGFAPIHAGDTLRLYLDKGKDYTGVMEFDLTPPSEGVSLPEVTDEARHLNERRKEYEDSLRLAYTATFLSESEAVRICSEIGLGENAAQLLVKSRGNHRVIEDFLRSLSPQNRGLGVELLSVIAEKDLHDITEDVLADNMDNLQGDSSSSLYSRYVLNPRIENEMLRPFKGPVLASLPDPIRKRYLADPRNIAIDLTAGILTDTIFNPGSYRQSAMATLENGTADDLNRSITFVAICRALGIPARIDPVSRATQFADSNGEWSDVSFSPLRDKSNHSAADESATSKSTLRLRHTPSSDGREPKYYAQYTLSRFREGIPELMEFDDFETVSSINSRQQQLEAGQYMLVTGQRLADGTVLCRTEIFRADPGNVAEADVVVRQDSTALQVIGNLDAELPFLPLEADMTPSAGGKQSILSATGRGYYIVGLVAPGHEPSAHALNDISAAAAELEASGRPILILFPNADSASRFRAADYGSLPSNVILGIDDGSIASGLAEGLELPTTELPLFVIADTFNRVVFAKKGYSIHLGEELAKALGRL